MPKNFPPRRLDQSWQTAEQVLDQLRAPPFVLASSASRARRMTGLAKILAWLEQYPGQTWIHPATPGL